MPRFSVIIPCYNAETYLGETLASLTAQTFSDWEAICINDGSTDGTAELLDDFAATDSRFVVVHQQNAGPAQTRNRGAELARAEILAFLDADDLWASDKLALLDRAFVAGPVPDAIFGLTEFFRDDPSRRGAVSTIRRTPLNLRDMLGENPVCTMSNIAVTARAFRLSGAFNPSIVHAEDLEWLVRLAGTGARIEGHEDIITRYRANESGLSVNLAAMHDGWRAAISTARRFDPTITEEEVARAEAVHLRYLARRALRTGQSGTLALKLASRGVRCSPDGFFSDFRRGGLTLAGALVAPLIPPALRCAVFAD